MIHEDPQKRPADVLVKGLISSENTWIDVGITHLKYDISDYKKGNQRALNYQKEKINKYKAYISDNQQYKDSTYRPFILQTDGVITKETRDIIKKIIELKSKKSDEDTSILTGRFKSILIALLMKQNAKNILQHYVIV